MDDVKSRSISKLYPKGESFQKIVKRTSSKSAQLPSVHTFLHPRRYRALCYYPNHHGVYPIFVAAMLRNWMTDSEWITSLKSASGRTSRITKLFSF